MMKYVTRIPFTLSDLIQSMNYGYAFVRMKRRNKSPHYDYYLLNLNNREYATHIANGSNLYKSFYEAIPDAILTEDTYQYQIWIKNEGERMLR